MRLLGTLKEQGRDAGGNLSADFVVVPGSCANIYAEKLSENSNQRKTAAGIFGHDTMTYRMRFRVGVDRNKIIETSAGDRLDIVGVENVNDRSRELLVTVRDRKVN